MSSPSQSRKPKTSKSKELDDNAFETMFVSLETFLEAHEPDLDRATWSGLPIPSTSHTQE